MFDKWCRIQLPTNALQYFPSVEQLRVQTWYAKEQVTGPDAYSQGDILETATYSIMIETWMNWILDTKFAWPMRCSSITRGYAAPYNVTHFKLLVRSISLGSFCGQRERQDVLRRTGHWWSVRPLPLNIFLIIIFPPRTARILSDARLTFKDCLSLEIGRRQELHALTFHT